MFCYLISINLVGTFVYQSNVENAQYFAGKGLNLYSKLALFVQFMCHITYMMLNMPILRWVFIKEKSKNKSKILKLALRFFLVDSVFLAFFLHRAR